ncbi:diphthine methyl ester synthase [Brevipalpus obovatus]|uniref:diphthine methyl ester synthase n=1 Tax=Brevipalpus obovatus TaxID=246614 RepID=UPI003D9F1F46
MLYLIGLGLCDVDDISVKGLSIVKKCDKIYLEHYTSLLYGADNVQILEKFYGKKIILADREFVEELSDTMLEEAVDHDVAFLVVGDPLGATTHTDLILRAVKRNIKYKIIHNASIMNAVGCCGLQLYSFGETVSIPLWTDTWKPDSFMDKIHSNKARGLHTLCLLDIKVKEKSIDALMKGKIEYEPPRFMTVSQAAQQILDSIEKRSSSGDSLSTLTPESYCIGLARVGSDDQKIIRQTLKKMSSMDIGKPLHSLVIEGELHPLEVEMVSLFEE